MFEVAGVVVATCGRAHVVKGTARDGRTGWYVYLDGIGFTEEQFSPQDYPTLEAARAVAVEVGGTEA